MNKNILLLFLSDVKTSNGKISAARYENIEGERTQATSESAVRYLLQKFPLDKIFIFASKKIRGVDKKATRLSLDDNSWTHLDFSLERLKTFLPGDDRYFVFDYDEDGSGEENLKSVAKMAGIIQKYVGDEEGVKLHVDLTGGMRHVNMMMLELTRLLEYSGLNVEKVIYSNYNSDTHTGRVEEVQNVYDLFQLMAGVEEFVNFGSVRALENYYKDKRANLSAPLNRLLDAMKDFADAIKLCHYVKFNKAIINLHDAVKDFKPTDDVEDVLMTTFIARIRKDYADLIFPREKDDLRVIRWCLDNDYLQQALILYTERIPEYLGKNGLITWSAAQTEKPKPFFDLFSQVKPSNTVFDEGKEIFCKAVKQDALPAIQKKMFDFDTWLAALNQKLESLKSLNLNCPDEPNFRAQFEKLAAGFQNLKLQLDLSSPKLARVRKIFDTLDDELKALNQKLESPESLNLNCPDEPNFRAQFETLAAVFQNPKLLLDLSSPALKPVRKILDALDDELKSKKWGGERVKILATFFNNKLTVDAVPNYFTGSGFMKYPKALKIYKLLNEGVFAAKDPDKFLSIADKYFRIKGERNQSAHAREDYGEFKTAEALRNFMQSALDEIEEALPAQ